MARATRRRLFLERRTYRRNRLQDAARLLPILGIILIFTPIFIRDTGAVPEGEAPGIAQWLVYFFVVWLGLIALTAFVSRALTKADPPVPEDGPTEVKDA